MISAAADIGSYIFVGRSFRTHTRQGLRHCSLMLGVQPLGWQKVENIYGSEDHIINLLLRILIIVAFLRTVLIVMISFIIGY
jgi:hypothetical protein